jgi:hypothetical protein
MNIFLAQRCRMDAKLASRYTSMCSCVLHDSIEYGSMFPWFADILRIDFVSCFIWRAFR